ncbi:hypothetical protein METMT2_0476 [Methanothermobacter sp. MT-2]|nr:hypothetical protein METMT2_0476 [Methanothermobacter sp. MT-2]
MIIETVASTLLRISKGWAVDPYIIFRFQVRVLVICQVNDPSKKLKMEIIDINLSYDKQSIYMLKFKILIGIRIYLKI